MMIVLMYSTRVQTGPVLIVDYRCSSLRVAMIFDDDIIIDVNIYDKSEIASSDTDCDSESD